MIKKIYDRDTGNIYDVGADNKLKLVAEGTLEWDEYGERYLPIYNFEEGKTYFIFLDVFGDTMQFIGTFYQNLLRTQYVYDWCNDQNVCLVTDADKNIYVVAVEITWLEIYDNNPYKVYELPFSL